MKFIVRILIAWLVLSSAWGIFYFFDNGAILLPADQRTSEDISDLLEFKIAASQTSYELNAQPRLNCQITNHSDKEVLITIPGRPFLKPSPPTPQLSFSIYQNDIEHPISSFDRARYFCGNTFYRQREAYMDYQIVKPGATYRFNICDEYFQLSKPGTFEYELTISHSLDSFDLPNWKLKKQLIYGEQYEFPERFDVNRFVHSDTYELTSNTIEIKVLPYNEELEVLFRLALAPFVPARLII